MDKVYLIAAFAVLAGCAAKQPESTAAVAAAFDAGGLQAAVAAEPSAVVEIADFTSTTVCKPLVRTGSRMRRGEQCTAPETDRNAAELAEQRRQWQIDDINRSSRLEMERQRREEMRRSFPMGRF